MKKMFFHIISTCFTPFVLKGVASCFIILFFLFNNSAKGQSWQQVGTGVDTLNGYNDGAINWDIKSDTFGNLYVVNPHENSMGKYNVYKWNGIHWNVLGAGANALNANHYVSPSLIVDDTNSIYVAGDFTNSPTYSSVGKRYVAKWNGTNWYELGTGTNALNADNLIYALTKVEFQEKSGQNKKDIKRHFLIG